MDGVDVFVSYAAADRPWAEWIAWELEAAGFTTALQAWDFGAGTDWVVDMDRAIADAQRTVAVLSPAYLRSPHAAAEWRAAYARDPEGVDQRLIPVRVASCEPTGLLASRVYVDLVGLDPGAARARLVEAFSGQRLKPSAAPGFPGSREPAFPGSEEAAGEPAQRRRSSGLTLARPSFWLLTLSCVVAAATAMFTLKDSPSAPRDPTPGPSSSAPAAAAGGGAAATQRAFAQEMDAICVQLIKNDQAGVGETHRFTRRLTHAGTGITQRDGLLDLVKHVTDRSETMLARLEGAQPPSGLEQARREAISGWRSSLTLLERYARRLRAARDYGAVFDAAASFTASPAPDRNWRQVTSRLIQLGGTACKRRSRLTVPDLRLRTPRVESSAAASSDRALSDVPLETPYDKPDASRTKEPASSQATPGPGAGSDRSPAHTIGGGGEG